MQAAFLPKHKILPDNHLSFLPTIKSPCKYSEINVQFSILFNFGTKIFATNSVRKDI